MPRLTLFYLALMGMELSYLYLLASLLSGPRYIIALILLLYPVTLLAKIPVASDAADKIRLVMELVLTLALVLAVIAEKVVSSLAAGPVDAEGIIARVFLCGLVWLMGYTVPQQRIHYIGVAFRLQIGILAVLIFSQISGSAAAVFGFFLLAPLTMLLSRWADAASHGTVILRAPNPGQLIVSAASVVLPGLLLILMLSPGVARAIVDWLPTIFLRISDWLDAGIIAANDTPTRTVEFHLGCDLPTEPVPPTVH